MVCVNCRLVDNGVIANQANAVVILLINAIAILSEDRFLARSNVPFHFNQVPLFRSRLPEGYQTNVTNMNSRLGSNTT